METRSIPLLAGILYLVIIALGLSGEVLVRAPLSALDPPALAARIIETEAVFRLSIAAETLMVAADVALAGLLYVLLAPAGRLLAAIAALFRLIQAAVISANLLNLLAALAHADAMRSEMAAEALQMHAVGYDLALIFFGINSVLTGILLVRHGAFPRWLGGLVTAAGAVYLTGSYLRIVLPGVAAEFEPAYLVAIIAETSFAVMLLRLGLRRNARAQEKMVGDERFELPTSSM